MKTNEIINKKTITLIVALALFHFVFLGTEYLFDNMMAYVTDSEGVVLAQSYILGASVLGFLFFPFLARITKENARYVAVFAGALAGVICIFVIWQHASYGLILFAGCMVFAIMGIAGSAVHYRIFCVLSGSRHLAKAVGIAYALGVLFQFLNNNLVRNDMAESIVLSTAAAILAVLLLKSCEDAASGKEDDFREEKENRAGLKHPAVAGTALIVGVILMTCIFSTLDVAVTLVHASGQADIGQWPRLILALSGLAAGVLYDIRERRYMNTIMYCVTLLSTICVVITQTGGPFLAGLMVFYLSAGFFVIFFISEFMELSRYMKLPQLWAGLGRAVNNGCALVTGTISVSLLTQGGNVTIILTALILFALISVAFFVYAIQFEKPEEIEDEKRGDICEDEKFDLFSEAYSLSGREQEILQMLLVSDENVQDIAEKLLISRAALYRHISNLNEKTGTKSRIGLIQFYYNWKNEA